MAWVPHDKQQAIINSARASAYLGHIIGACAAIGHAGAVDRRSPR